VQRWEGAGEHDGREEEGTWRQPGREIHAWSATASSRLKGGGGVQDRKVGETPSKPPRVQLKGRGDVQARKVGATPARPAWVAEGQSTAASRPARFRAWRGAA
jgi:hypothetical protein